LRQRWPFLELVVRDGERLAGFSILDLRAPVRHAHRLESEEADETSAIDDFIADLHSRRGLPQMIGIGREDGFHDP
jgi:hypothetical protein